MPRKPSVVLICADDLGFGDLRCYGNPYITTPFIDSLARAGLLLRANYAVSPICAPARAGLLTGQYAHRVGALSVESNRGLDRISLSVPTIADEFRGLGYRTAMFGKWHNGLFDMRHHPLSRGFEDFFGFLNGGMWYDNWLLERNGSPVHADGRYLTDALTDEAIGYMETHRNEPFFLYLAYNAPHTPLQVPEEEILAYRNMGLFNDEVQRVYAMITRMDKGVGRILATLERLALAQDTIVVFTSDNGADMSGGKARFGGPLRGSKQDVLEGGIRVPCLIRWPEGLPGAGREVEQSTSHLDLLPTLLAACGGAPSAYVDGRNVLSLLRGEDMPDPPRFWQYNRYEPVYGCNCAMREGRWKLYYPKAPEAMKKLSRDNVWYQGMMNLPHFEMDGLPDPPFAVRGSVAETQPQLYDLYADIGEQSDLSAQHPVRMQQMQRALRSWFQEVEERRRAIYKEELTRDPERV